MWEDNTPGVGPPPPLRPQHLPGPAISLWPAVWRLTAITRCPDWALFNLLLLSLSGEGMDDATSTEVHLNVPLNFFQREYLSLFVSCSSFI